MQYRSFGKTGWEVSAISVGGWAIGGNWGVTDDKESLAALHKAIELGVNFIDTADRYGDGRSERLIGQFLKDHPNERIYVVTKAGRLLNPHTADGYNRKNLTAFVEQSLRNLDVEALDLLQLHCPPEEVYDRPEVFGILDDLQKAGRIRFYGTSVVTVSQARKSIEYSGVKTVQMIFNLFRHKPADAFFAEAREKNIGIIVRLPLASGMLTGKMTPDTTFPDDDHRRFNYGGVFFDKGETFSGVEYEKGLAAVEELKKVCPPGATMAQFALRWILMFDGPSCAIPGAKRFQQAEQNTRAADLPELTQETMYAVKEIYDKYFRAQVHPQW